MAKMNKEAAVKRANMKFEALQRGLTKRAAEYPDAIAKQIVDYVANEMPNVYKESGFKVAFDTAIRFISEVQKTIA